MPHVKLMPTGGVTATTPATGFAPARSRSASARALVDRKAVAERPLRRDHRRTRANSSRARCGARRQASAVVAMAKVVCFGEIMLRLSPPGFERLLQSPPCNATFGGGEANVAVSLAQFGHESHYVTRLPANPIGDAAREGAARRRRARRSHVMRGGDRARDLLRGNRREPAAVDGGVRPRAFGDQRDGAGHRAVGRRPGRRRVVPLHRHHAGAGRRTRRRARARRSRRRESRRRAGQRRPELPQEALVERARRSRRCARSCDASTS